MAGNRNLITTESRGKRHGDQFDDLQVIQDRAKGVISGIDIRHGACLDAISVYYVGQTHFVTHGGRGGSKSQILLELGEHITKIEGAEHGEHPSLSQLMFFSNRGRKWGPFGCLQGSPKFTWNASPNMALLYFTGSASITVGSLQATFATLSNQSPLSDRAVRYEIQGATKETVQDEVTLSVFARNLMSSIITLTVGEQGIDFYTNQDVLCRLPFFRAALHNGFKESVEKHIVMLDDEPEIVAALIEFLASGKYTYTYRPSPRAVQTQDLENTPPCNLREGSFHLRVYATAFKYDCQGLVNAAMESLIDVLRELGGIDIIHLLKEMYLRGCDIEALAKGGNVDTVKQKLPGILQRVYEAHGQEMKDIVCQCPALANDLLRLSVAARPK